MESGTEKPTPTVSIPAKHLRAAAGDVQLKRLLRDGETALRHVERAQKEVVDADLALAQYVAATYPPEPAAAPEPA